MENTDINTSNIENVDIDRILKEAIKEKIEKLMETELNAYLEENPGIKNGKYKRDLKTKYGEIKGLNVPRDRDSNFHTQAIEPYNRSIGIEDLIVWYAPLIDDTKSSYRGIYILSKIYNSIMAGRNGI